ncbi:MAG: hypothetical protein IT287_01895, partial [Bdellovibrionaceae bacterium]|nr:hypothetical protein [Pseudobdellovibrionaceae bacterium]
MPSVSCLELQQKYTSQISEVRGDLTQKIDSISAIENIKPGSFIYVAHDKYVDLAEGSPCTLVLAPKTCADKIPATSKKVWFLCANPELLMANIKKDIFLATPFRNSHLPRRALNIFVPSSAKVAETATLGPGVVLGENVVIGENTYIGANTVIEQNVSIGNNCTLHPLVYVGHSCLIGNNCEILPNTSIGTDGFGYAHDE